MIEIDVEPLCSIGLTPPLLQHVYASLRDLPFEPPLRLMRLVELHRESARLHDGRLERAARVLPRLLRGLEEADEALAVGDWVVAGSDAHGDFWLHERLPPLTRLARRDADGRRHALAANVDSALLVMGLDDDFNPRRLERYAALLHGSGVLPVVVLSKADVAGPDATARALQALAGRVPPGADLLAVDARAEAAAQALAPHLAAGRTLVVLGSSGAGKSTLTNTLLGQAVQDTGAVRASDGRGMHTTTARSRHRLPGGACLIDTPGLRALRPDADAQAVAASFGDIEALALQCRFRDCRHVDEPGCAVRAAVAPDRLRNFHKLLREARRDTQSALERQRQVALWKARGRESRVRMRAKRGE